MAERALLLRGGRVVDPSQGVDDTLDVLLTRGEIAAVGHDLDAPEGADVRDVAGLVVAPGLVDVHVHLREPGGEHKETIATGAWAAAVGGFTSICAMPNTDPPIDDPAGVGYVVAQGRRAGAARVYPVGAVSVGQKGERLTLIGEMVDAGAVAITDDGLPVADSGLMRLALEYSSTFGIPVADHCEDPTLSRGGSMNEGIVSTRLGITGIPSAAENVMIARDLFLAELTGGRLHIQHVSTRAGVEMIRAAKARGVEVTAEATPHHFTLTDEAVVGYRTEAKVNPPLRTADDVAAVREGVRDGTLDCIATDHAPHHYDEKEQAFEDAPFGLVGLETALALGLTELVDGGVLGLPDLIDRMSTAPARAFGLPAGTLREGAPADVTVFDVGEEWTVDPDRLVSKSRNTPFAGRGVRGRTRLTIVGGHVVWSAEQGVEHARQQARRRG
ncbi:MAG: amidohydrolase family protein [Gemmatimonadetes bacterium]|nr:dihydroorotase [Gemmatimonadota bacterium]NIU80125.1 amidohydrolase family protein [Gammaproteobacteria bacterium]NIP83622.1 dihydroorotase [Gemmatimonadota bacterium]NIQ59929.1 dihydroorotase [Gemmatimonadota bacterium]NIW38131.1 amidohydrolase family protein [Gemmatimonadota bacterium]